MNQTYQALLSSTDGVFVLNNEFVEINKRSIINLDTQDYDFFWGCMKLYDAYGINYMNLVTGAYGDFSGSIEDWLASFHMKPNDIARFDERKLKYYRSLSELIKWLHFFDVSYYNSIRVSDLETLLEKIPELYRGAYVKLSQQYETNREIKKKFKIESYYNFEDFSIKVFSQYVEKCTKYNDKNIVTIDDALNIAKGIPKHSYIVLLIKNNKVCFIGKTENLLVYIGSKNKKHMADGVVFEEVDKAYIDDVLLATKIFFNYPLDGTRITKANRKFVTIQHAWFVHRENSGLSKKQLLDIIHNNLQITYLENGRGIVDKLALERVLGSNKS